MSTFDEETLEAVARLPRGFVEDVLQELADHYEHGQKGAKLMVEAAGKGDQHVRRFDGPDSYRHSKG
ncbi:hypothetical protein [Salinibacter altiplanensis]|uniref:hypothetical protein n=1 Tax=Salinibacter altiplanensis TaxID=1803181 RepID=UPI000C9F6FFD|nr:hypothetical protein [Salinibacter altiplanensis]